MIALLSWSVDLPMPNQPRLFGLVGSDGARLAKNDASRKLIVNAEIPGFDPRDLTLPSANAQSPIEPGLLRGSLNRIVFEVPSWMRALKATGSCVENAQRQSSR